MLLGALIAVMVSAARRQLGRRAAGRRSGRRRRSAWRSRCRSRGSVRTKSSPGWAQHPRRRGDRLRARRLRHLRAGRHGHVAADRHPPARRHPVARRILSGKDPLTYLAWLLVPADRVVRSPTRARDCGCAPPARGGRRAYALGLTLRSAMPRPSSPARSPGLAGGYLASASSACSTRASWPAAASSRSPRSTSAAPGRGRPPPRARCSPVRRAPDPLPAGGLSSQLVATLPYLVVDRRADALRLAAQRQGRREVAARTPALILVDVIRAFFDHAGIHTTPRCTRSSRRSRRLLAQARAHDRVVVHAVERHRPGLRRLRAAEAAGALHRRRTRRRVLARLRARRAGARDRGAQAPLQRLLRHRPRADPARAGSTASSSRGQDQRLHPRDLPGRLRARLRRGGPREATNSNRPHLAAASLEDIGANRRDARVEEVLGGCDVAVLGYASLDRAVAVDALPAPTRPRSCGADSATLAAARRMRAADRRAGSRCGVGRRVHHVGRGRRRGRPAPRRARDGGRRHGGRRGRRARGPRSRPRL